jgi:hypothetical protein
MVSPFIPRRQVVDFNVSNDDLVQTPLVSHAFQASTNVQLNFAAQGGSTQDNRFDLPTHYPFGAQTGASSARRSTGRGRWNNWVYGWKHAMGSCAFLLSSNIHHYQIILCLGLNLLLFLMPASVR